jgi:hypothetical protein
MTYFDEHGEYWGDKTKPIIGAGNGKLTARSVKIFADGALRTGYAAVNFSSFLGLLPHHNSASEAT